MLTTELLPLEVLFDQDETAWLEAMSALAAEGRFSEMDHRNLSEYLADMAKRDRREVFSRLVTLLTHLLKWAHQPKYRGESWLGIMTEQRRELRKLLESAVLRNHAANVLAEAYSDARKQVAAEAGLARDTFTLEIKIDLDTLLVDDEGAA